LLFSCFSFSPVLVLRPVVGSCLGPHPGLSIEWYARQKFWADDYLRYLTGMQQVKTDGTVHRTPEPYTQDRNDIMWEPFVGDSPQHIGENG
jgi:hypothetical protein